MEDMLPNGSPLEPVLKKARDVADKAKERLNTRGAASS